MNGDDQGEHPKHSRGCAATGPYVGQRPRCNCGLDPAPSLEPTSDSERKRWIEDLKGHARVLASRGQRAERSWPPEVVDAYEIAMCLTIRRFLTEAQALATKVEDAAVSDTMNVEGAGSCDPECAVSHAHNLVSTLKQASHARNLVATLKQAVAWAEALAGEE